MDKVKRDAIVQAVECMKKGQYGATAIKVELEAQLNRGYDDGEEDCGWCDEGTVRCGDCDGDGYFECHECDGEGHIPGSHSGEIVDCYDCTEGHIECDECEDGYITCGDCDGNWQGSTGDWSDAVCHEWIMSKMAKLGIAEEGKGHGLAHGMYTSWNPTGPLSYAEFYRDGSVDSEFTFTLMLTDPNTVFLLPKIIQIWNDLAAEIGNGQIVNGAGMHMALLSDPNGHYPTDTRLSDTPKFGNFKKSMTLLLPALYFLGSGNSKSRGLSYRRPEVGAGSHRSAIDFRGGALEFRVFDTCYDNPDTILDNLVVMSRCLRFWTNKYTRNYLSKVANNISFGNDSNGELKRLYITREHIDLLNNGLRMLKPSYYTIRQLKDQREFNVTKTHINNRINQAKKDAVIEYKEYEQRFGWTVVLRHNNYTNSAIEQRLGSDEFKSMSRAQAMKIVETEAKQKTKEFEKTKKSINQYIDEKITSVTNQRAGNYSLSVSEA